MMPARMPAKAPAEGARQRRSPSGVRGLARRLRGRRPLRGWRPPAPRLRSRPADSVHPREGRSVVVAARPPEEEAEACVGASAAQKPRAAETIASRPVRSARRASTSCAASRMPSPAIVKGLITVTKIWIEEPEGDLPELRVVRADRQRRVVVHRRGREVDQERQEENLEDETRDGRDRRRRSSRSASRGRLDAGLGGERDVLEDPLHEAREEQHDDERRRSRPRRSARRPRRRRSALSPKIAMPKGSVTRNES